MNTCCKWVSLFALLLCVGISEVHADHSDVKYISLIDNEGIKIKKPGVYRLQNSICVDLEDNKSAITIEASNVVLDLNEFTLSQEGCGRNNFGIRVKPHYHSVIIKNGTIQDVHGFGIKVEEDIQGISLQDLLVKSCGSKGSVIIQDGSVNGNPHTGGILFLGKTSSPVLDVSLLRCQSLNNTTVDPSSAVDGLLMYAAQKVTIDGCHFSDNFTASELSVTGANFFYTQNTVLKNTHADKNLNNALIGTTARCFGAHFNTVSTDPLDSNQHANILVTGCTFNNTLGHTQGVGGIRFRQAKNIVVEDCEAHQTTCTFQDDVNSNNTITAAAGFIVTVCDNFSIKNCSSYQSLVTTPSIRLVGGFDIARSNYGLVNSCHAANCQNQGTGELGGFILENTLSRPAFLRSIGVCFEGCLAEANIGGALGGGFALLRGEECKIINCEAIANAPYGIQVGAATLNNDYTRNSFIKNNLVYSNSVGGIVDLYTPVAADVNAYWGNIARDNNASNFTIPTSSAVVVWAISLGNTVNAEDSDNVSIT